MKNAIQKGIITLSMSAVMFGVVGATIVSAQDEKLEAVSSTSSAGEYQILNLIIQKNWSRLSEKEKLKYLKNPKADIFFPFGIDVSAKAPKGYPDCDESDFAATYKQTAKLPEWCFPDGKESVN